MTSYEHHLALAQERHDERYCPGCYGLGIVPVGPGGDAPCDECDGTGERP